MYVLIVGNIIKDTYLELEPKLFEVGKENRVYLEMELDEEPFYFKSEKNILSGACIIEEIVQNFHLNGQIQKTKSHYDIDHRFLIKCKDKVKYLTSEYCKRTQFYAPERVPDWIFIDRSARLDVFTIKKIITYLETHKNSHLAFFAKQKISDILLKPDDLGAQNYLKDLLSYAELVFLSGTNKKNTNQIFHNIKFKQIEKPLLFQITPESLVYEENLTTFDLETQDFLTHLSIYSIVAGTIFAALISGWNLGRAIKLAKLNLENAKIGRTLDLNNLYKKLKKTLNREKELQLIAESLTTDQKGILAIDESKKTIRQKLRKFKIIDTKQHQEAWRELLVTTPKLANFINGVILSQETIEQKLANNESIPSFLIRHGILAGVKADLGLEKDARFKNNFRTLGLEDLDARLINYFEQGLRFVKWRTVFNTEEKSKIPHEIINQNIDDLCSYVQKAVKNNLIPIMEPEVLRGEMDISQYFDNTKNVLSCLFHRLEETGIDIGGCILKINMIYSVENNPLETGRMTMRLISEVVPEQIGGIVFLSGGQSPVSATENLAEIIRENKNRYRLSFSFGRAIQDPALTIWNGEQKNTDLARQKLYERLEANCRALGNNYFFSVSRRN